MSFDMNTQWKEHKAADNAMKGKCEHCGLRKSMRSVTPFNTVTKLCGNRKCPLFKN